jgi:hypothetical protein
MILISHRGNINGRVESLENEPKYIDLAISKGYDVEIDVWVKDDSLWLGHDEPQYEINIKFLLERKNNLWVHTKNFDALSKLIDTGLKIFYHEKENHTIINNTKNIWSHNLLEANVKSIIPLLSKEDSLKSVNFKHVYGICSDYLIDIKL